MIVILFVSLLVVVAVVCEGCLCAGLEKGGLKEVAWLIKCAVETMVREKG